MGVTLIKRIENRSRSNALVLNKENANARGANITIAPGNSIEADMAIPWAPNQPDFQGHHLEVRHAGLSKYRIWQAANADGDFIRFSTDGAWHDHGDKIHGYPGVAKNFFEAVGGAIGGNMMAFADILLSERALVILDSHFEMIPIAPKPLQIPFTTIKRIENLSTKTVTLFNKEKTGSEALSPAISPGSSANVNMTVPWAGQAADFGGHRLELRLNGQTRFWIWQAKSDFDGDYVRFATSESWTPTATRVKGISATGETPADLAFNGDRTLVVRDSGFELLPNPLLLDKFIDTIKPLIRPAHRVSETALIPAPTSVPKKSAVAFSFAGPPSDAFKRSPRGARFLYKDSGKRYEFTLNSAGTVIATDADGNSTALTRGWSFTDSRLGKSVGLPPFDLIAASGGRLFAKAKDSNAFYIGTMDHMFPHAAKDAPADAVETSIAPYFFKLDPQYGTGASTSDLLATTINIPPGTPMSERLPIFHRVLQADLVDMMIAPLEPGVLQEVDFRPPQNVLAVAMGETLMAVAQGALFGLGFSIVSLAPLIVFNIFKDMLSEALRRNAELASAPPPGFPTYTPITYARPDGTVIAPPVIKYERVLDIGVSHTHYFQQYDRSGGGEMQPMLQSDFIKILYRFLNGPIQDGDGFIDGTCNIYALVKHQPTALRPHGYALLFQDEQAYFSQRWRLVDPDDTAGLMAGIRTGLASPEYRWNPATYWCPFRNGHINDRSRLATAAYVLAVTGADPVTNVPRIYTINSSWGTMDRTWRYRAFPPAEVTYFDQAAVDAGNEPVQADGERVYPQTIRMREDLTMHLKGAHNFNGRTVAGRWYQRYLPANNAHVPAKEELVAGRMPVRGYFHGWKFLPENLFQLADSFSHFGVYDTVDSRCQYYDVTPVGTSDANNLDGGPGPWIDDTRQLYVSQWKFRYDPKLPGADPVEPPSLFNADTRLRIVRRGSRWIAMHWDKRDDDLVPFERLPMTVTLKNGARSVRVAIGPYHEVKQLPMVLNAYFWLEPDGTAGISFVPVAGTPDAVSENVWRVRMSALQAVEDPVTHVIRAQASPLADVVMEGSFTPVGMGRYERRWTPSADELTAFRRFCSPEGASTFATSLWFEDLVGHVCVPEQMIWQRSPTVTAIATPNSIPLDRPVEVTVMARDSRTQQTLDGEVRVDNVVVARTGQRFTHTFRMRIPPPRIVNPGGGRPVEPIEPPDAMPPAVTVTVPDYPSATVGIEFFNLFSGAEFVRQTVPTNMIAGRTYPVSVTMRNIGTVTWTNTGPNPFRLGSQSPQDNNTWGTSRRELPGPIPPGGEVTFAFDVIAPAPGIAQFRWRMLQEFIEWFGGFTPEVMVFILANPTMAVTVTPLPVPTNRSVSVVVRALDEQTGAPVAGRVLIDRRDVGPTNTAFNFTFRIRQIPGKPPLIIVPSGSVAAPGYEAAEIDFGLGSSGPVGEL